ncbi:kinase-like protein [Atractiella rhizophila]|nr:kinase-like protein [Atractiella rhizophila]
MSSYYHHQRPTTDSRSPSRVRSNPPSSLSRSRPYGDLAGLAQDPEEDMAIGALRLEPSLQRRPSSEAPSASSSFVHVNSSLSQLASSSSSPGPATSRSMMDIPSEAASDREREVVTTSHLQYGHQSINQWVKLEELPTGNRTLKVWLCENAMWDGKDPLDHYCAMKCMRRQDTNRYALLKKSRVLSPHASPNWKEQTDLDVLRDEDGEAVRNNDESWKREIAILKRCSHPHVVRLLEVINDQTSKKVYMALEFMKGGGTLWQDGRGGPALPMDKARWTLRDVASGLEYLHTQGIIHRDVKPTNLLWNEDHTYVKISDFSESVYSDALKNKTGDRRLLNLPVLQKTAGTPAFYSPEACMIPNLSPYEEAESAPENAETPPLRIDHNQPNAIVSMPVKDRDLPLNAQVDVWALGITVYCLLFGRTPWDPDLSMFAIYPIITDQPIVLPLYMGSDQKPVVGGEGDEAVEGAELVNLMTQFLEKDPRKRITLEGAKSHPWALRNLPKPQQWLTDTRKINSTRLEVTHEDLEKAIKSTAEIDVITPQQIASVKAGWAERAKSVFRRFLGRDEGREGRVKAASRKASSILQRANRSRAGSVTGSVATSSAAGSATGTPCEGSQSGQEDKKKRSVARRFGKNREVSSAPALEMQESTPRRSASIRSAPGSADASTEQ